jgi:Kef-type K+ transport system membrane component KefB
MLMGIMAGAMAPVFFSPPTIRMSPPETLTSGIEALRKLSVEDLLLPVLVQLVVIIAAARLFGILARAIKQPSVVGEIVAGLLLGPSLVGWLMPEWHAAVFRPALPGLPRDLADVVITKIFVGFKEIGLIFLLFFIGLDFDYGHLKLKGKSAIAICLAGILVPFSLGLGLAPLIHPHLEVHPYTGLPVPLVGMMLFLGTTLSITALPVLGRMMIELGIHRTSLAAVVIAAAAAGDAVGWILLAGVAGATKGNFSIGGTLAMVSLTIAFCAVMLVVVRPLAVRYFRRAVDATGGELTITPLAVLFVLLLLAALATNRIGIFAVFGAFMLGAVLSDQEAIRTAVGVKLRDFITAFFLPIFFTYNGLRTDLTLLTGSTVWVFAAAIVVAGIVGKIVSCGLAARFTGYAWKESALIGVMMNTRGLMAPIIINVGYDLGVIPRSLFSMLILMSVTTTLMTVPLLYAMRRGTELEQPMRESGFGK